MTSTTTDFKRTFISKKLAYIRALRNLLIANEKTEKQLHTKMM